MDRLKIAVSGADNAMFECLQSIGAAAGLVMLRCDSEEAVITRVRKKVVSLVITCSNGKDPEGSLNLTHSIRRMSGTLPVVFVAGQSSEQLVVEALRAGATDYFKIPLAAEALQSSLVRLLQRPAPPLAGGNSSYKGHTMIGSSRCMQEIRNYITRVAATDSTVLITGETGTGKELAADMIQYYSPRRHKPLVRINCSAIPDNLIESELFGYERGAFTWAQGA